MQRALFLLGLFALVYSVSSATFNSETFISSYNGTAGHNVVYYSNTDDSFFSIGNIQNPINIEIVFINGTGGATANVCLNPNQKYNPTPGNNMNSCPSGGLVTLSNSTTTTSGTSKLKFTRKNSSLRGLFLSKMVEDDTNTNSQPVYASPSTTNAGFTVIIDSDSPLQFTITISGNQCENGYPINGDCQTLTTLNNNSTNNITISANSTAYYMIDTPKYVSTEVNQLIITHDSPYQVLLQSGYLPTTGWYITQGLDGNTQTINTPGTLDNGETYFVALLNPGDSDLTVSLIVNFTGCSSDELIGPGCAVNLTYSNSTDGSTVIGLSATLTAENGGSNNGGSAWELGLSDSENAFAYFQLIDLPIFPDQGSNNGFPYYVRVSVGNTDLEDDDGNYAPEIFAKLNGIPSSESFDVSASGSVANQVILQVNDQSDEWFIAVSLPADFSIWVGVNCAGNCSSNDHGSCQCGLADGSTVDCQSLVNSTNTYPLYSLPVTSTESSGACDCSDSDYDNSFDCTQKSSPTVLFIILIVIGGLIILFVAIGVPLYCYISNKRKERYERI